MASPARSPHLSDGVLLALHDRERDDDRHVELDGSRAHLADCETCRARAAEIAEYSARTHESLSAILVPSVSEESFRRHLTARTRPAPVSRRPTLAAAAAVIVLAAAAAASPVRDWLRRRIEQPRVETRPAAPAVVAEPAPSPERGGATISFAPTGATFTLRFDSLPEAGSLRVITTPATAISARVAGGAGTGGDEMVVLPGEIRVRNAGTARASYELSLPASVTRLRVIVAGVTAFDGTPPVVVRLDRRR